MILLGSLSVNNLKAVLHKVARELEAEVQWKADRAELTVEFSDGRKQRIHIERRSGRYLLTSVVLGRARVEEIGSTHLLPLLWQRNRETNVVAFDIDQRGRLIGRVEQVAETLDAEELAIYTKWLARQCDRLEYILSGLDIE